MAIGILAAVLGLLLATAAIVIPRIVGRHNDPEDDAASRAYLASTGRSAQEIAQRLVGLYDHLRPFPDAVPALRALAGLGYELAVLSNGTPAMIDNCLGNSGLGEFFGQRVSVDEVRAFKPSPVVYRHAAGRLSVTAGQVRLVTSNAFDCVGASAAGMRTAWVNRSAAPFDTIGAQPDLTVPALDRLPAVLGG